jgi:hypothetical protein
VSCHVTDGLDAVRDCGELQMSKGLYVATSLIFEGVIIFPPTVRTPACAGGAFDSQGVCTPPPAAPSAPSSAQGLVGVN